MSNFVIFLLAASILLTEARWDSREDNSNDRDRDRDHRHGHGNGNDTGSGSGSEDVEATTEAYSGNSYMEQMQEVAATLDVLTNDSVSAADKVAYFTQLVMEQIDNTDIETQTEVAEKIKNIVEFFTQIQLMIASASKEVQDTYKEIVALASDPSFYSQTAQSQIDQVEAYFNKMTDAGKAELNKLDQEAKAVAEKLGVQTRKFILGNIHGAISNFGSHFALFDFTIVISITKNFYLATEEQLPFLLFALFQPIQLTTKMTAAEDSTASEVTVQLRVCTNLTKPIQLPPMDKWIIHKDEIVYNGRIICHMEKRGFLTERTNTLKGRNATVTKGGALIIYEEIKLKAGNLLMIAVNDAIGQWRRALHEAIERRQDKDKKREGEEGTHNEAGQSEAENESEMAVKENEEEMGKKKKKKQVTISAAAPEIISVSPPSLTQTDCESASTPVACLSPSPSSSFPVPSLPMFRAELIDLGPALPVLIPLKQCYISTASLTLVISSA